MTTEDVLDVLDRVQQSGKGWTACCPAHDDRSPSLSIHEGDDGKLLMKCFAGCEFGDIIAAIRERASEVTDQPRPPVRSVSDQVLDDESPLTVAKLAEHKQLPDGLLLGYGVRDLPEGEGVAIAYRDEAGRTVCEKRRLARSAKSSRWPRGQALMPYGRDRLPLARARKTLIIAEGESDAWTGWMYGLLVLALPGANTTGVLEVEDVQGIETIYIIEEPDQGGSSFLAGLCRRLQEIGWRGDARVIRLPEKDLSDLHLADPEHFLEVFEASKRTARSLDDPDPSVWQPPRPLRTFDPLPFPVEALPGWLRKMVESVAMATQTPPDLAALLGLSAVATACQKRVEVEPWDGYREPVNIYTVVALPPASRKSTVFAEMTQPIRGFEADEARRLAPELSAASSRRRVLEHALKKAEEEAARAIAGRPQGSSNG